MNWRRPVRALNRMACNQSPSDGPLQQTFITHYTVSGLVWEKLTGTGTVITCTQGVNWAIIHTKCILLCVVNIKTLMIPKIEATEIRQLTYLMSSKSLLRQTLPLLAKY